MIKNHIPNLNEFSYECRKFDDFERLENTLYTKLNQFTSSFWTERHWFFETEISTEFLHISNAKRLLFPGKDGSMIMNMQILIDVRIDQSLIDKYKIVFNAVQFIHLDFNCEKISKEMLVTMIQLLPNLDSLKVSSLQVTQQDS